MTEKIEFDYKEFTRWWEDYNENKHKFDKRIEEALEKARFTFLETEKMIENWKDGYIGH